MSAPERISNLALATESPVEWTRPLHREHVVHFYEEERFPIDAVGQFLAAGLEDGVACVAIATEPHWARLGERLHLRGVDWTGASKRGQLVVLDAGETLSRLLVDGQIDEQRFTEVVGGVVSQAVRHAGQTSARAFGEMVDILFAQGNYAAAIRLEELWNDLIQKHRLSLICTYSMSRFHREAHAPSFEAICKEHSQVIPTARYTGLTDSQQQLRMVAQLQQKAHSLEAEIEQRIAVEQQLRAREQELADFLENAVAGIHKVGPDGVILWANKAELTLLGYAVDEYVGHSLTEFYVDPKQSQSILARLIAGATLYDEPAQLRCKDGSVKHVRIHSNASWENGQFLYTRCFTRDVTDRVRLDLELQRKVQELGESNRRKDEFLAMLGHELRNPLAPLQMSASAARLQLARGEAPDRQLEIIERQAESMGRLVDDLLDVARITRGVIELRRECVEVAAIAARAVDSTHHLMQERRHTLAVTPAPESFAVFADPLRIEQILVNLLVNAAKYTPPGGHISLAVRGADGGVELCVRDSGVGIAEDMLPRVFDLFEQAERGLDRSQGGLGIGLTIARRLAELHGGSIEARSEGAGRGAEFTLKMPLLRQHPAQPSSRRAAAQRTRALRVLVVDDNADAADVLADLLRDSLGHEARVAYEGRSALGIAAEFQPDVVLLDIGLPQMDGYEVARGLRGAACRARLVAVTGYGQDRDRQRTSSAGFSDHLVKPVQLERLLGILNAVEPG